MNRKRSLQLGLMGVILAGSACITAWPGAAGSPPGDGGLNGAQPLAGTVVIDAGINHLVFSGTPGPPGGTPAAQHLSADAALKMYRDINPSFVPPAVATYRFGYYTAEVGDGSYRFLNTPAWGISFHECAHLHHPVSAATVVPCTHWLFLDALTGDLLEGVWQA